MEVPVFVAQDMHIKVVQPDTVEDDARLPQAGKGQVRQKAAEGEGLVAVLLEERDTARFHRQGKGVEKQQLAAQLAIGRLTHESRGQDVHGRQHNQQAHEQVGKVGIKQAFAETANGGVHGGRSSLWARLQTLAIGVGGQSGPALEGPDERTGLGEARAVGDFFDRQVALAEKV